MIKQFFINIYELLFPNLCAGCLEGLPSRHHFICYRCLESLPKTNFHTTHQNSIFERLSAQYRIHSACGFYFFIQGTPLQHIIHHLKYKNKPELGVFLGNLLAQDLVQDALYPTIDVVVPLPLHYKKYKKRGYNQSEKIAEGLAQTFGKPINTKAVQRVKNTQTQASLPHQNSRENNVKNAFAVIAPQELSNKHVLLIDDVFTTGATLSSCIKELETIQGIQISVLTLATTLGH